MATHSSILVWRIPWTEEPGQLQSTGSQRVGHNFATKLPPVLPLFLGNRVNHKQYFHVYKLTHGLIISPLTIVLACFSEPDPKGTSLLTQKLYHSQKFTNLFKPPVPRNGKLRLREGKSCPRPHRVNCSLNQQRCQVDMCRVTTTVSPLCMDAFCSKSMFIRPVCSYVQQS